MKRIMIGTRTSRLARAQTEIVTEMLRKKFPALEIEVVPVTTMGDRLPDEKRAEVEGKGAFTEDLETLLQKGEVDAAVHSMKDLPTKLGGGLAIGATPVRADPRDALVSSYGLSLPEMPEGAVVGTSSVRRKAQLLSLRSDIELVDEYARFRAEHPEIAADMAERQERRAWTMGELLSTLRTEYGEGTGYLAHIGVLPGEIRRLRDLLVG